MVTFCNDWKIGEKVVMMVVKLLMVENNYKLAIFILMVIEKM